MDSGVNEAPTPEIIAPREYGHQGEDNSVKGGHPPELAPAVAIESNDRAEAPVRKDALSLTGRRLLAVSNADDLQNAISNDVTITLAADIFLSSTINIEATGLVIDGMGSYKIDGQGAHRCLFINNGSDVTLKDILVTNGYADVSSFDLISIRHLATSLYSS